jgi:hypothetical protein
MNNKSKKILSLVLLLGLLALYFGYVVFVIQMDQGPVDYETFMRIGSRFLNGQEIYGENSYYPMPFVMIFGFFAGLPRPVSMALWLLLPILAALVISGGKPWVLLFAPLFGHFVGGQSAIFGMVGLWGYRNGKETEKFDGGLWLALTTLKPQLGVIPTAYAIYQWWKLWRRERRISKQAIGWLIGVVVLYVPSFIIYPNWVSEWLASPRPLALRAMAGIIPRSLAVGLGGGWIFWSLWLIFSGLVLVWIIRKGGLSLDRWMLWYFIVSPLVHDYDLIQLIPQIGSAKARTLALILSIPLWLVILFFYNNNLAWFAVTLIAPGLLIFDLWKRQVPGKNESLRKRERLL